MSDVFETLVGRLVLDRGWVTRHQLVECLKQCGSQGRNKDGTATTVLLSEVLIDQGLVSRHQIDALRNEVSGLLASHDDYELIRKEDMRLGHVLLKMGAVSREQIELALQTQRDQARREGGRILRLGEILIQTGFVGINIIEQALKAQSRRTQMRCSVCDTFFFVVDFKPNKKYLCRKCTGNLTKSARPKNAEAQPPEVEACKKDPKNVFGKYVLVNQLGQGGMGVVYKAWDTALHRWVAIKTLMGGEKDDLARFRREAQTAAQLRHPNIVGIFEVGVRDDRHFIAMEYVEGRTLVGRKFPVKKTLELMRKIALAVDYAHSRKIVHRDIKPQNIVLDPKGRPFVMDFGLARSLSGSTITMTGTIVGTPSYMPPEQALGLPSQIDVRSDVYMLGAVMYEMLTGRPPFKGSTPVDTLHQVVNEDVAAPRKFNGALPKPVEAIVLKAMEKEKARRYESADAFADDIQRFLDGESIAARPRSTAFLVRRGIRKYAAIVVAASVVVVALAAIATVHTINKAHRNQLVRVMIDEANVHFNAGRWQEARLAYDRVLELTPENAFALRRRRKANEEMEYIQSEARRKKLVEDRLRREAEDVRKRNKSNRLRAQPHLDQAKQIKEEALLARYRPGADLANMESRLREALPHLDKAIAAWPEHHEAIQMRGQIRKDLRDYERAITDFTRALEIMPTYSAAYRDRGLVRLAQYRHEHGHETIRNTETEPNARAILDEAGKDFDKAVKLTEAGPEQSYLKACKAFTQDRFQDVIRLMNEVVTRVDDREAYYLLRGDAHLAKVWRGRTGQSSTRAIRDYSRALNLRPNFPEALHMRGYTYQVLRNGSAARADFQAAVDMNRTHPDSWYFLGQFYYRSLNLLQAARCVHESLKIDPESYRTLCSLGGIRLSQGRYGPAADLLDKALKMNPRAVSVHANREYVRHLSGSGDEALRNLSRLIKEHPNGYALYRSRGMIHILRLEYGKAVADFDELVRIAPAQEPTIRSMRAQAMKALDQDR